MKKQIPPHRLQPVFLVVGIVFLAIGIATNQTAFSYVATGFILVSLIMGGRWLKRK